MNWTLKAWTELSVDELYQAYKLRTDVFVVEQGCAYPEIDEHDPECRHLFAWKDKELQAYARICPPHSVYPQASLGRIVVKAECRGQGLGRDLVRRSLQALREEHPNQAVKIQAQEYLESFYASFGFKTITSSYPDVMVMHVDMLLDSPRLNHQS